MDTTKTQRRPYHACTIMPREILELAVFAFTQLTALAAPAPDCCPNQATRLGLIPMHDRKHFRLVEDVGIVFEGCRSGSGNGHHIDGDAVDASVGRIDRWPVCKKLLNIDGR